MEISKSIKRTKKAFTNAFFDLLNHDYFEKIKLTDIIRESGYSQSTFYKYYDDKYDFAKKTFFEELHNFSNLIIKIISDNSPVDNEESVYKMHYEIYSYVEKNQSFFDAVVKEFAPQYTITLAAEFLHEDLKGKIVINNKKLSDSIEKDFMYYHIAHELLATIKYWKSNDSIQTVDDITRLAISAYNSKGYFSLYL